MKATLEALVARLESVKARALAVTMGVDTTTDASALLAESNPLWGEVAGDATAMLPVVTEMARALGEALEQAPAEVKAALGAYREAAAAARFDWIEPPRILVAFLLLEALERIRDHCATKVNARR